MRANPHPSRSIDESSSLFHREDWFHVLNAYGISDGTTRAQLTLGESRLALIREGGSLRALSNFYSPTFGFMNDLQPLIHDYAELGPALRELRGNSLYLTPLREDETWVTQALQSLKVSGFFVDLLVVSTNWFLPCASLTWPDYLEQRPSRLRNTLRRCHNKLAGMPGFRIEIIRSEGPQLEEALADYARVYAASWKEAEPFPLFMPALCRMAARHGWLRLGLLYVGGEPAAAQIWFVKDRTASIYKLAYDSRFAKTGAGTVLSGALFEHTLDVDKVKEIDFLTGDDAYKVEWMTHQRRLVALLAFDKHSFGGLLRAARHFGPRWLKRKLGKS